MRKINLKKFINGRNTAILLLVLASVFLVGQTALAGGGDWAGNVIGGVIAVFIKAISSILVLLVGLLMQVAAYSDFINAEAVTKGWIVVRDICNMFFVVVLLVIAFATILSKEEYGAKKMLPKLVMAAVLINFSKLICGLMIDLASVVMLTFVSAFSAIGAGNILDMLGISNVVKISGASEAVTFATIVSSYIFGLIYVLIATVVVASMLAMLVMRIVMIWILVVLSPFAFFLQAVPGKGQQYASQWWTRWTSNLIVGPVIAFFLWLSFAALGSGSGNPITGSSASDAELAAINGVGRADTSVETGIGSEAGTSAGMAKFVIAIGMLLGGMKIAQEVGGETGAALGKGMAKINKGKAMVLGAGAAVGGFAVGRAKATAKSIGRGTRNMALSAVGNIGEKDLVTGKPKGALQNFALQWRDDLQANRKKIKTDSREKFLKKIGISEAGAEKGKLVLEGGGLQTVGRFSKTAGIGAAVGSIAGPLGTLAGAGIGAAVGGMVGLISKKRFEKAKMDKANYETSGQRAADISTLEQARTSKAADKKYKLTQAEQEANLRMREYRTDNKIVSGKSFVQDITGGTTAFEVTGNAMNNMIKKKKMAQDWVKVTANDPDYLQNISNKGDIYSNAGVSEVWKRRLDELNDGGVEGTKAVNNMVDEVSNKNLGSDKLTELAKLIAGYEKGGAVTNSATLGRLKNSLIAKGYDPAQYTNQVSTLYKKVGSDMELKSGSGGLQYDTFARNSAKDQADRNPAKDIMGVSFAKLNAKAKELKLDGDLQLDENAGVNQKVDGAKLTALSLTMSGLIDDEIKSLQSVGTEVDTNRINQLQTAKARLDRGDISGLSLKNTDVSYKGATDSEKRRAEYNTTQHEIMHQAGAKNEDLVYESADALQESKLIGRVPGTNQRYDEEIGRLIATMEKSNTNPDSIREAVSAQIDKWQPTSNAQRVIETETGQRDTINDSLPNTEIKTNQDSQKIIEALDKLGNSLQNPAVAPKADNIPADLSISDRSFFFRTFESLKKTISKSDELLGNEIKPLVSVATHQEKKEI